MKSRPICFLPILFAILFNSPTDAQPYQPLANRSNRRNNNQSHVVRGCELKDIATITLLAPEENIGITSSKNPTFLIDLDRLPPTPLIVSIVQLQVIEPFYYREFAPTKAGRLEIETNGNLSQGEYILTIGYFCQRDPDRNPIYLRVFFKKEDLSSEQERQLSQSPNPRDLLFDWGFFFDAVAWKYKKPISNPSEF